MIPIQCACGRNLRLKDELAGKRVRCPECSETVKVPAAEPDDAFLEDIEDDSAEELPKARSRSTRSTKKASTKTTRRKSGPGLTAKQIFGYAILALGVVLVAGMVFFIFSGEFQPKRLRALILPFLMIGMGWAWIQGKTYGE